MTVLVTGSTGHLGEAMMRCLAAGGRPARGLDLHPGPFTHHVGSITDRAFLAGCLCGVEAVVHAATLHKPHMATHAPQDFVDTNVSGTLALLEAAVAAGIARFVFTSTTSAFGAALTPAPGAPAAWIDETVPSVPKNIYGATKTAAEDLCQLYHRRHGLAVIVLRTSRFFPEEDDARAIRDGFSDENAKANEFAFRRVDLEDAVGAHLAALDRAGDIGFGRYVISATTPFARADAAGLRRDAAGVAAARVPGLARIYGRRGYRMFAAIDRIYDNARARRELGWRPTHDFARILGQIERGEPIGSALARSVGRKGYHAEVFADGPYPVEP